MENIAETEIPAVSRPVGVVWPDGQTFQTPQTTLKNHPEHSKTRFFDFNFLNAILNTNENKRKIFFRFQEEPTQFIPLYSA